MQGEQTTAVAWCPGRDDSLRGDGDTAEVLLAVDSPTEYRAHENAIEAAFHSCEVRTKALNGDVEAGVAADVLVVEEGSRERVGVDSLRTQNPDGYVLGIVGDSCDVASSSFDEVLPRPVTDADLVDAVGRLLRRRAYNELVEEHLEIASELATLEATETIEELDADTQYTVLSEKAAAVESASAALFEAFDNADFDALFRRVER